MKEIIWQYEFEDYGNDYVISTSVGEGVDRFRFHEVLPCINQNLSPPIKIIEATKAVIEWRIEAFQSVEASNQYTKGHGLLYQGFENEQFTEDQLREIMTKPAMPYVIDRLDSKVTELVKGSMVELIAKERESFDNVAFKAMIGHEWKDEDIVKQIEETEQNIREALLVPSELLGERHQSKNNGGIEEKIKDERLRLHDETLNSSDMRSNPTVLYLGYEDYYELRSSISSRLTSGSRICTEDYEGLKLVKVNMRSYFELV